VNHAQAYLPAFSSYSSPEKFSPKGLRILHYKGILPSVIAQCYEINEKILEKWVEHFENEELLNDLPRSGRPSKLPKEQQEELRQMIAEQNQRIWVARHVYVWLTITFKVYYSVRYLPEFLRKLGLSFHKAVHTLIQRDNEKTPPQSGGVLDPRQVSSQKNGVAIK